MKDASCWRNKIVEKLYCKFSVKWSVLTVGCTLTWLHCVIENGFSCHHVLRVGTYLLALLAHKKRMTAHLALLCIFCVAVTEGGFIIYTGFIHSRIKWFWMWLYLPQENKSVDIFHQKCRNCLFSTFCNFYWNLLKVEISTMILTEIFLISCRDNLS